MADETDLHVGKRLRRRRRLLGMTQQDLASQVGVRFQQIQKYECGANRITASRLYELAKAMNVSVQYFFDGMPAAGTLGVERVDRPTGDRRQRHDGQLYGDQAIEAEQQPQTAQ